MIKPLLGALLGAFVLTAACGGGARPSEASGPSGEGACATGKRLYLERREELLATLRRSGCRVDGDCGVLWENNGCVSTCGVSLPASQRDAAARDLDGFARANCGSCPPIPTPPCVPPGPTRCQQGQCVEAER